MSKRTSRRTRSWKRNLPWSLLESLAASLIAERQYLVDGLSLQKSSGIWAKANGLYTVRLVYRSAQNNSLVFSFTNINLGASEREALR